MQEQEHPTVVSLHPAAGPLQFKVVESWREVEGVAEVGHIGVVDEIRVGERYRARGGAGLPDAPQPGRTAALQRTQQVQNTRLTGFT